MPGTLRTSSGKSKRMTTKISAEKAAQMLKNWDNILILCHKNPDGDTLGSGAGLCHALCNMGKNCKVRCSDAIPEKYDYMKIPLFCGEYEPEHIVAVDVAGENLLGDNLSHYRDKIELDIDHHATNSEFAKFLCLKSDYPAAAQLVYEIILAMGEKITPLIADCLHTGILTDTGCFKYPATTPQTLITAAHLMESGANHKWLAERFFMQKSAKTVALEKFALNNLEYGFDGRYALLVLDSKTIEEIQPQTTDTDGLASFARDFEGVEVSVLLRQTGENTYKVSVRTSEKADATKIACAFGGGGHVRARGATATGNIDDIKKILTEKVKRELCQQTEQTETEL